MQNTIDDQTLAGDGALQYVAEVLRAHQKTMRNLLLRSLREEFAAVLHVLRKRRLGHLLWSRSLGFSFSVQLGVRRCPPPFLYVRRVFIFDQVELRIDDIDCRIEANSRVLILHRFQDQVLECLPVFLQLVELKVLACSDDVVKILEALPSALLSFSL